MPRHTLDKWTYKLKTMDVCITQHKEEDIYNHMVKMFARMEELYNKYKSIYDSIIDSLGDTDDNIYRKYNWKQGEPSRFWKKNANLWFLADLSDDEKEIIRKEYFYIFEIYCDFMSCDNHYDEWAGDWSDMLYDVTKMWNLLKNTTDTIILYEQASYHQEKARWQIADRDWIQENDRKKEHKNHPTIELPNTLNYEEEPKSYPTEPLRDDCIYCKQHWEETKPRHERCIEIWLTNKQEDDDYKKQQELEDVKIRIEREKKAREYQEWLQKQEPIDVYCSHCEYEAKNESDLNRHNLSEEHDQKLRYCKCCELQCRSDYDFKNHISSSKHKKKAGLISTEKPTYKCNQCDYESNLKSNYERHLSLKHKC